MIERLKLANVGPAQEMELEFAPRLNVFTGDNGLGKSFILDIAWWALTRTWPAEIGHKLTTGLKAFPYSDRKNEAAIEAILLDDSQKKFGFASKYNPHIQRWDSTWKPKSWKNKNPGDPKRPGLAIYVMSDGSFAVQDYHRNPVYWPWQLPKKAEEQGPFAAMKDLATMTSATAFVFNAHEVWNGLDDGDISGERWILCNGLIRDWAGWQKERGEPFEYLQSVLKELSPPNHPPIVPGKLTRISLGDVRDMPTVKMPYGQEIALVHASSGL
ncbi:MAG: AAA family ATPase, partial [Deltaproteobacteria bacterium]|nr:AAA family ATPase [Deltaproteobacteria bacterium]